MNILLKYIDYIIPIGLLVLYCCVVKASIPHFVYAFAALAACFHYIRQLTRKISNIDKVRQRILLISSYILISLLVVLSIANLYIGGSFYRTVFSAVGIANALFSFWMFASIENEDRGILHHCFVIFVGIVLFV